MKSLKHLCAMAAVVAVSSLAQAQVVIDSLTVQGYMKKANGTAVTNGSYSLIFGVRQNGTTVWAKQVSTAVSNGLFAANLSGLGTNLASLPVGTAMNSDFSAVTLNPALLQASGNGGLVVRVYANTAIDSSNPQFDITLNSAPTAFVANVAQGVAADAVGLAGISSAAKTNSSAGAGDAGKLVLLNSSGKVDDSMFPAVLPALDGSNLTGVTATAATAGSLTTAAISATAKANASAGVSDAGKLVLLNSSGQIDSTMIPSILPAVNGASLTGVIAASVAANSITLAGISSTAKTNASTGTADAGKIALLDSRGVLDSSMYGPSKNIMRNHADFLMTLTGAAGASTFLGEAFWTSLAAGPTFAVSTGTTVLGVGRIVTAATANAPAVLGFCGQTGTVGTPAYTGSFSSSQPWVFEVRLNVSSTAAGTGFLRFGYMITNVTGANASQGAYLEQAAGAATVTAVARNAGGAVSTVTSTLTTGTFATWKIVWDGTNMTYYKDGVSLGSYTTNIPSGMNACPGVFVFNSASGMVTRNIDIDYMTFEQITGR